jgi:hypothetical protein
MGLKTLEGPELLSGDEGNRTPNPRLAKAVLCQLSYVPERPSARLRLGSARVGFRGLTPQRGGRPVRPALAHEGHYPCDNSD